MAQHPKIIILTGAGLSAESGVPTFRDPNGMWAKYDWRDVATPDGFQRDPALVLNFYNARRRAHRGIKPNAAHIALARLEAEHGGVTVVTQNIDALHEAAGSHSLIHMHGELFKALCTFCKHRVPWQGDLLVDTSCPYCGLPGGMRPDVVWFGEMPYQMGRITGLLGEADLFLSIGTSGHVYPAAGFVAEAREHGARTVELNLEPSEGASQFDEAIYGHATEIVPAFVDRILAGR
nr:NAD-dependent deacylase [Hyphomicrobium sp. MC1]